MCGKAFELPRAGKLYCSNKCKQFAFYHRGEISQLNEIQMQINDAVIKISRNEFEEYKRSFKNAQEYSDLVRRRESNYLEFNSTHEFRLTKLQNKLPQYLKSIKIPLLTIEEWSFLKVLYPNLKKDEFLKLLASFGFKFFQNLTIIQNLYERKKANPIQILYTNHISKIVEGKILFE